MKDIQDLYRENIERLKRPYGESCCVHELKAQISILISGRQCQTFWKTYVFKNITFNSNLKPCQ